MLADEAFKKLIEKLDKKFANSVDESDDIVNSNDPDVIVEEVIYLQNGQEVGKKKLRLTIPWIRNGQSRRM